MIGKVQQDSFQSLRIQIDGFSSQLSEPFGSSFGLGTSLGDSLSSLDRDCPSGQSRVLGRSQSQTSPTDSLNPSGDPTGAGSQTSRYKTEMCRTFEENGTCKYGEKCQFAHGGHEVRNVSRHPKYKTDLCKTYHSVGFCPYGPRCHFIHALDEMRSQPTVITPEKKGNGPVKQLPMFGGSGGTENCPPWTLPSVRNNEKNKQADMDSAVNQLNKYFNMSANIRPALSPSSLDSSRSGSCSDTSSLPSSSPPPENGFCSSPRRPLFDRPSFAWHSYPYNFSSTLSPSDHDHLLWFPLFLYNQSVSYFKALQLCLNFSFVQIIKVLLF